MGLSIRLALIVFVLAGCSTLRQSHDEVVLPPELIDFLASQLSDELRTLECEAGEHAPLLTGEYYELSSHNLLVLAGLPDYLCRYSNSFVPIVVTTEGETTWGKALPGVPSFIVQGPDKTIWLVSQWAVEGTYPMLFRSENGVDWTEILLPEDRGVDCCFEYLNGVCFFRNVIRLRFDAAQPSSTHSGQLADHGAKTEQWSAVLESVTDRPVWRRLHEKNSDLPCDGTILSKGRWLRQEDATAVRFVYPPCRLGVRFPDALKTKGR
jgi:hypothetical protein